MQARNMSPHCHVPYPTQSYANMRRTRDEAQAALRILAHEAHKVLAVRPRGRRQRCAGAQSRRAPPGECPCRARTRTRIHGPCRHGQMLLPYKGLQLSGAPAAACCRTCHEMKINLSCQHASIGCRALAPLAARRPNELDEAPMRPSATPHQARRACPAHQSAGAAPLRAARASPRRPKCQCRRRLSAAAASPCATQPHPAASRPAARRAAAPAAACRAAAGWPRAARRPRPRARAAVAPRRPPAPRQGVRRARALLRPAIQRRARRSKC